MNTEATPHPARLLRLMRTIRPGGGWTHRADLQLAAEMTAREFEAALDELITCRMVVVCQPTSGQYWYAPVPAIQDANPAQF